MSPDNNTTALHQLHSELRIINEVLKMAAFAADASLVLKPTKPYDEAAVLGFISDEQDKLVQAIADTASRIGRNSEVLHHAD